MLFQVPSKPFRLFIQREQTWPEVMNLSDCIQGKIYVVDEWPVHGPINGQLIGATLELPWRNNLNKISRIAADAYEAKTRDDGPKGWRIELQSVLNRTNVQLHIGNFPKDSVGCVLVGKQKAATECAVLSSGVAMQELRDAYGKIERPIEVFFRDA